MANIDSEVPLAASQSASVYGEGDSAGIQAQSRSEELASITPVQPGSEDSAAVLGTSEQNALVAKPKPRLDWGFGAYTWQIPVALACIVLGIMVGLQYRAQVSKPLVQVDDRRKTLELVRTLEAERNKLSAEITEIRGRMADLEDAAGKRESVSKQMQDQLNRSRIEAGLTGIRGPGVLVELSDSPRTPANTEDPYFFIIHDVDLQALVNELWASGAEAVSINEQRIVARTSIRCVGPTILVNGVRLTAPYLVKGIGPGDLETALRMPGGFLDSMAPLVSRGGQVKVTRSSELAIAPYEGSLAFRYGQAYEDSKE